ncbi:MAG: hypothetical protein M1817_005625 [Caeruleum heppii]|nr:MAG: hypothetical protein M1817_005625 [Caeruleum heppii]
MSSDDPLVNLLEAYNDLNPPQVDVLHALPTPLQFMRYVALNRPFVVRGGVTSWAASTTWDVEYLKKAMGHSIINVAVTPHGNADAIVISTDGSHDMFVKPFEVRESFREFLGYIIHQEKMTQTVDPSLVKYAQSQNNNLPSEYAPLAPDVPSSIDFADFALERSPDAVNIWIGNSHSVSALHKDNYENIYCQVIGTKTFVLVPPVNVPCIREEAVICATYVKAQGQEETTLQIQKDIPEEKIPFPLWDPDEPSSSSTTAYTPFCKPLRATLQEGDLLYLPALWYHKVSQTCSAEGVCCAVNYWYDMDFQGPLYPLCTLVRDLLKQAKDLASTTEDMR